METINEQVSSEEDVLEKKVKIFNDFIQPTSISADDLLERVFDVKKTLSRYWPEFLKFPFFPIILPNLCPYKSDEENLKDFFLNPFLRYEDYRKGFKKRKRIPIYNMLFSQRYGLWNKMKGKDQLIGLFFPTLFKGFSEKDFQKEILNFPLDFHAAGPETFIAYIMHTDYFLKTEEIRGLDILAFSINEHGRKMYVTRNIQDGFQVHSSSVVVRPGYEFMSTGVTFVL